MVRDAGLGIALLSAQAGESLEHRTAIVLFRQSGFERIFGEDQWLR